ncbi:MAG: hypothetical protein ACXW4U_09490, partial [Anaerolineales bacterium]
ELPYSRTLGPRSAGPGEIVKPEWNVLEEKLNLEKYHDDKESTKITRDQTITPTTSLGFQWPGDRAG